MASPQDDGASRTPRSRREQLREEVHGHNDGGRSLLAALVIGLHVDSNARFHPQLAENHECADQYPERLLLSDESALALVASKLQRAQI